MRILLFLLLFFGFQQVQALPAAPFAGGQKGHTINIDSSIVHIRTIDTKEIRKHAKESAFRYDDVAASNLSLLDRFGNWLWQILEKIFNNKASGTIITYLAVVLVIAIIVFVVIKLAGLDISLVSGKSKTTEIPFEESLENIHAIDFDTQIEKALETGNYRLAVRLLYLKTLKRLSDRQLINWLPDKTNQAYVQELQDKQQQAAFGLLTQQFEYVWYGDFFIDSRIFENINQSFQKFNR